MVFAGQVLPGLPFLPLHSFTPRHTQERSQAWSGGVGDSYSGPSL